jgi:hypothetical protein
MVGLPLVATAIDNYFKIRMAGMSSQFALAFISVDFEKELAGIPAKDIALRNLVERMGIPPRLLKKKSENQYYLLDEYSYFCFFLPDEIHVVRNFIDSRLLNDFATIELAKRYEPILYTEFAEGYGDETLAAGIASSLRDRTGIDYLGVHNCPDINILGEIRRATKK